MKKKIGFTLAEATIVLVILGVIAGITIPTFINRQTEIADRTRLKKAWEVYDRIFQTMRADNLMMTKDAFVAWANQPNCPNTVPYFKTTAVDNNNACLFKTPDGIWFNITDIMHPEVSIASPGKADKTFTFVVTYNPDNLTFTVNDPTSDYLTDSDSKALKKLLAFLDTENDGVNKNKAWDSCKNNQCKRKMGAYDEECTCTADEANIVSTKRSNECKACTIKYYLYNNTDYINVVFDDDGRMLFYSACPKGQSSGCWSQTMYEDGSYDELYQCDASYNICSLRLTYNNYGKIVKSKNYNNDGKFSYGYFANYDANGKYLNTCYFYDEATETCK